MEKPEAALTHCVVGRGRLGQTIVNGLIKSGVFVADTPEHADLIWFAVPEKVLKETAVRIAVQAPCCTGFIHTSGLLPSKNIAVRPEIPVASLHPAHSFPVPLTEMPGDILWVFEGDESLRKILIKQVRAWKGKWAEISSEQKIAYHIACVFMGNLTDIPVAAAEAICRQTGIPFRDLLNSLFIPHISQFEKGRILSRTTGPAARGDVETVRLQAHWLKQNFPEYEEIYAILSTFIAKKHQES
ncbi:MAG: DUF2520 domain-containing protein [Acidobacteria bacterium]|nr:DUF2520 domain-containing protein [Acidobacteriota bacterium]